MSPLPRSRLRLPSPAPSPAPSTPLPPSSPIPESLDGWSDIDDRAHSSSLLIPPAEEIEIGIGIGIEDPESCSGRKVSPSFIDAVATALRKSVVMCSGESRGPGGDGGVCHSLVPSAMDIGMPTDVKHVVHVSFDRFSGFLGLTGELETDVLKKVPSVSASIFGVSPSSLHCSYDSRGNSVPSILLLMQRRLYCQGGLQAEGIFRINANNAQEESVRRQLNSGVIPNEIDVHCLAGLIKAWFRELPIGVLDSIDPDQMNHSSSEEECSRIVAMIPPMEAALLDWSVNLMADVVHYEHKNKMNARNIAMVFAPNMTQMSDPLTALMHAVQVMNFLKTLILRTLRERKESDMETGTPEFFSEPVSDDDQPRSLNPEGLAFATSHLGRLLFGMEHASESDMDASFKSCEQGGSEANLNTELASEKFSHLGHFDDAYVEDHCKIVYEHKIVESLWSKSTLRRCMKKLCCHSVFNLNRSIRELGKLTIVRPNREGREAWAS